jgi:hypothetical protein
MLSSTACILGLSLFLAWGIFAAMLRADCGMAVTRNRFGEVLRVKSVTK